MAAKMSISHTAWRRAKQGSGGWLAVGIALAGLRLLRKWSKRERQVVYRAKLAPGKSVTVKHRRPSSSNDQAGAATQVLSQAPEDAASDRVSDKQPTGDQSG